MYFSSLYSKVMVVQRYVERAKGGNVQEAVEQILALYGPRALDNSIQLFCRHGEEAAR